MSESLESQNALADSLLEKLERIKTVWTELPSEDDLADMARTVGGIAESLKEAQETFSAEDFPSEDELTPIAQAASTIASSLEAAIEAKETLCGS
jgi:hypothetical protein